MNNTELPADSTHTGHKTSAGGGASPGLGGVENNTTKEPHRWPWRWLRRRPGRWVASCRDEARRRRQLLVVLTDDGRVALVVPPGDVAVLDLLAVGALRAALREAVFAAAERVVDPGTEHPHTYAVPTTARRSA